MSETPLVSTGASGATPTSEEIRKALRLGWVMAEVHGRNRLGDDAAQLGNTVERDRTVLPLAVERTPAELRIEAEKVLTSLVGSGTLNPDADSLGVGVKAAAQTSASSQLTLMATTLYTARKVHDAAVTAAAWAELAEFLYLWDARIQDVLASGAFGIASAYQLGRGLAEVYWALDMSAQGGAPGHWDWVLSEVRCEAIKGLLERLAGNLSGGVSEAIASSLADWRLVAMTPQWRAEAGVMQQLNRQTQTWRDLLVTGFDPLAVVGAAERVRRARDVLPYLGAFWAELLGLVAAILATGGALYFITDAHAHNPFVAAVLTGLGVLGVTTAGVVARLKVIAGNLVGELHKLVTVELITANSVYLPRRPRAGLARALPSRESVPQSVGAQLLR